MNTIVQGGISKTESISYNYDWDFNERHWGVDPGGLDIEHSTKAGVINSFGWVATHLQVCIITCM